MRLQDPKETKPESKALWVAFALLGLAAGAYACYRIYQHYNANDLVHQQDVLRAEKVTREAAKKQAREDRERKRERKNVIDTAAFFKGLTLSPDQQAKADQIASEYQSTADAADKQNADLRAAAARNLAGMVAETNRTELPADRIEKLLAQKNGFEEKVAPKIDTGKQSEAQATYGDFLAKSKEIDEQQKTPRQKTNRALVALLTPEQRKAFNESRAATRANQKETTGPGH